MRSASSLPPFRLRSFVRRDSRRTAAQERAHETWWPRVGLNLADGLIDLDQVFGRDAPRFMEIGFGTAQSLLAVAKAYPEKDFIGVETHKPGIGALLLGIEMQNLTNLRAFYGDVVDVLEKCIPAASLDGIQIFFPDPWPKRRHHARRLIQPAFLLTLIEKLKPGGSLHLATDWEDYAHHMMRVLSQEEKIENTAGLHTFSERSPYRPILTKFESRAIREGRHIWELQFRRS